MGWKKLIGAVSVLATACTLCITWMGLKGDGPNAAMATEDLLAAADVVVDAAARSNAADPPVNASVEQGGMVESTSPPPRAQVLRQHAGLYADKSRSEFQDIILLTAANSAYMDFLQNWECHARRLNLDWVVLALDDEAYRLMKPENALPTTGSTSKQSLEYLSRGFNLMSLNTLATVFEIMKEGFDVVFTDSDNVFLTDPFAPGVSFGKLIPQRYDYIYQINWPGPRNYVPAGEVNEGNTGFYFASMRKAAMKTLWEEVLQECRKHPQLDGQPNFWNALRRLRKSKKPCFRMCHQETQCNETMEEVLDYCEMNPFQHRTGWGKRDEYGPVSYHANFKVGKAPKIAALRGMGVWRPTCT